MISFSTQGSTVNNPSSGLNTRLLNTGSGLNLGFLPKMPYSNIGAGITLPTPTQPTQSNPLTGTGQPARIPVAPTNPGLLSTPKAPVKKITTPDGTTTEYHKPDTTQYAGGLAPDDPSNAFNTATGQPNPNYKPPAPPVNSNAPVNTTAPGTVGNPGTNFPQNLANVQTASNLINNPEYAGLAKENNELYQESLGGQTAGVGGTPIPGVGTNNANYQGLFAPQSTASLTGKENVFNTNNAIQMAGNAAEEGQLLNAGQLQTQGAENVAGLTAPQQIGALSGVYNPGTNTFAQGVGSAAGTGGLAGVGALQQQQQQGADVQTMTSSLNQTSSLIDKTKKDIANNPQFNATPVPLANALEGWLATNTVSSPQYANIINDLSEIANTIAPVLGVPGNPTNMKTIIATELVPKLLQGQDIGTVLDNLEQNAQLKIDAAKKTADSNTVTQPGTLQSKVVPGSYTQNANGEWEYNG
jgi:hypothetical protein